MFFTNYDIPDEKILLNDILHVGVLKSKTKSLITQEYRVQRKLCFPLWNLNVEFILISLHFALFPTYGNGGHKGMWNPIFLFRKYKKWNCRILFYISYHWRSMTGGYLQSFAIFHVSAFYDTGVPRNAKITRKIASPAFVDSAHWKMMWWERLMCFCCKDGLGVV